MSTPSTPEQPAIAATPAVAAQTAEPIASDRTQPPIKPPARDAKVDPLLAGVALRTLDVAIALALLALVFLLGVFPLKDTDFWWHLRAGDLIRATGSVPRVDLFTYAIPNRPWIDLHWIFQVLISHGYEHGGVPLLNVAKCAVATVAIALLLRSRLREAPLWARALAWLPALLLLGGRMYIRPETMSLLYMAIYLAVLSRLDEHPSRALILPVVQLFWVNSHGLFVFGLIFWACALFEAIFRKGSLTPERRRWWLMVGGAAALSGLVCFVNPYGIRGALYPFELLATMSNPIFAETIAELQSVPSFIASTGLDNLPLRLHLLTAALGAASFVIPIVWLAWTRVVDVARLPATVVADRKTRSKGREKQGGRAAKPQASSKTKPTRAKATESGRVVWELSFFRLFLYLALTALSFRATRNSHQFAAVVGAITAWNFGDWAAAIVARQGALGRAGTIAGALRCRGLSLATVVAVFVWVAGGWFYAATGEGRTIGLGEEPHWFPHRAAAFAGRPEMPPRMIGFHLGIPPLYEYMFGPERKVFIDARLEVVGERSYTRYHDLERLLVSDRPEWRGELASIGLPIVVADHQYSSSVEATLLASGDWRCVYWDELAGVYVHQSYREVVERDEVVFGAAHFARGGDLESLSLADAATAARGGRNVASGLSARRRDDLAAPIIWEAMDHARRAFVSTTEAAEAWKMFAHLVNLTGRAGPEASGRYRRPFDPLLDLATLRATYATRRAIERNPDDFTLLFMLAEQYRSRGMDAELLPVLERLADLSPKNKTQTSLLASLRAQARSLRATLKGTADQEPARGKAWSNLSELEVAVTALLDAGRVASAAEVLAEAYPAEARPWRVADRLALLELHLGRPERARAIWHDAKIEPAAKAVYEPLRFAREALAEFVGADYDRARELYHDAIARDPSLFEEHYVLSLLECEDGHATSALESARAAERTAPNATAREASKRLIERLEPFARDDRRTIK